MRVCDSALGQTRSSDDVRFMSGLTDNGHWVTAFASAPAAGALSISIGAADGDG